MRFIIGVGKTNIKYVSRLSNRSETHRIIFSSKSNYVSVSHDWELTGLYMCMLQSILVLPEYT